MNEQLKLIAKEVGRGTTITFARPFPDTIEVCLCQTIGKRESTRKYVIHQHDIEISNFDCVAGVIRLWHQDIPEKPPILKKEVEG